MNYNIIFYPILAYKEKGDRELYAFKLEKEFRHTSRELLRSGIFNGVIIIDSNGTKYKIESARENGYATPFWGYSLALKGRQIYVDFDFVEISKESLEDVRSFVLDRLRGQEDQELTQERTETVKNASSIENIISCLF